MVKLTLFFLAFVMMSTVSVAYCGKKGGGKGKGGKGGCGGKSGGNGSGSSGGKGCGGGGSNVPSEIQAAVISTQTVKIKPFTGSSQSAKVPTIIISSGSSPLNIHFQSASSDLNITQDHTNSKPQVITSNSVDGGIILRQTIKKPILQEVKETIFPERKIIQEIMPVKEIKKILVAASAETTTGASTDEPTTEEESTTAKPKKYKKKKYGKKKMTTTEAPESTSTEGSSTSTEGDTTASDYMLYGRR